MVQQHHGRSLSLAWGMIGAWMLTMAPAHVAPRRGPLPALAPDQLRAGGIRPLVALTRAGTSPAVAEVELEAEGKPAKPVHAGTGFFLMQD